MRIAVLVLVTFLVGCASSGPQDSIRQDEVLQTRQLSVAEKDRFRKSLAQTLKDYPEAALFKWMPLVIRERDGVTDYCGLLNGRNSSGAYTGFAPFYAQLIKNTKGDFDRAVLKDWTNVDDQDSLAMVTDICTAYGYKDFTLAN